jgi:hypothetical protein
LKVKFMFCFMETTHEPLYLDIWRVVQQKIMDIPMSFIWIINLFDRAFKYGDCAKF